MKPSCSQQKLSPVHHQHDASSRAALPSRLHLPPRPSSSRGTLCAFSEHHREMKRSTGQEKPVSTAKSVTAAAPFQSFRQQTVFALFPTILWGEHTILEV